MNDTSLIVAQTYVITTQISNSSLSIADSLSNSSDGAPKSFQRMAKIFQIISDGIGVTNSLYLSIRICYPPYKWLQITAQLAAMGFLTAEFSESKENELPEFLARMLINALSISRFYCELKGTKSAFLQEQPPLNKVWFALVTCELMSRAAFAVYQHKRLKNKSLA